MPLAGGWPHPPLKGPDFENADWPPPVVLSCPSGGCLWPASHPKDSAHYIYWLVRLHKSHSGGCGKHNSGFHAPHPFSQTRVGLQCGSHFSRFKALCLGCQMPRPCLTHRPQWCQHGAKNGASKTNVQTAFSSPHCRPESMSSNHGGVCFATGHHKKQSPRLPEQLLWCHEIRPVSALQIALGTRVRT